VRDRSTRRLLSISNGSDKIFDTAVMFRAWRTLNSAANIHRVWRDRFDRGTNILRV